jgi:hypothetical protein
MYAIQLLHQPREAIHLHHLQYPIIAKELPRYRDSTFVKPGLLYVADYFNAEEIWLKTCEIWVPRMVRTIMITIAIKTMINAYSTIP